MSDPKGTGQTDEEQNEVAEHGENPELISEGEER